MRKYLKVIIAPLYWRIMNRLHNYQVESTQVGFRAVIGRRVIIRAGSEVSSSVKIGDYSYISGPRSFVGSANIGKFCSIARETTIGVSDHNYRWVTTHPIIIDPEYGIVKDPVEEPQKPAPIIGNDVWVGMGAFIMRGVSIGDGAVVAANSVVTRDVAPYSIVGGNPARHIKFRFPPEIVAALLEIRWWDWSDEKIRKNRENFRVVEAFVRAHQPGVGDRQSGGESGSSEVTQVS